MRYVTIPKDILLFDPMTGAPLMQEDRPVAAKLRDLIVNALHDPKFGQNVKMLRLSADIQARFDLVQWKPGAVVALSDDEWKMLSDTLAQPSNPYIVAGSRQLISFFDVVENAPTTEPARAVET